jgi:hypothetical protein
MGPSTITAKILSRPFVSEGFLDFFVTIAFPEGREQTWSSRKDVTSVSTCKLFVCEYRTSKYIDSIDSTKRLIKPYAGVLELI